MTGPIVEKFRRLVTDLELLRVRADGLFPEEDLQRLEVMSYEGRHPDDQFNVSEGAKRRALKRAEEKFPELVAKG